MRRGWVVIVAAFLLIGARQRVVRPPALPKPLSITRSFEITDKTIVGAFTLDRVLTQLIARSGVTGLTSDQLIRQMFDTQNPKPGLIDASSPHCDDSVTNGVPSFNGFPRRCPTPEGKLAGHENLVGEFYAIGIANRFDQAPADGSNCGQFRIVFAHRDAQTQSDFTIRRHLIFEPVLPNPNPSAGIAGCRAVAEFWAGLSSIDSLDERRARLERFFFEGIDGFAPAIDPPNFAEPGGIRSFGQTESGVRFYQFRLAKPCRLVPDVLENSAFASLFDARNASEQAAALRAEFLRQLPDLTVNDVNLFSMKLPKEYLLVESAPTVDLTTFIYSSAIAAADPTPPGKAFRSAMQAQLDAAGSKLTTDQIVVRAEELGCFGCHAFSGPINLGGGLRLESSNFGNQMISEDNFADGERGPKSRYGIDPIIEKQFAPHRLQIMEDFLRYGTPPVHSQ